MARGDSGKKVARAARAGAGGGTGERRALGFPLALVLVVVLGVALIAFARSGREATAAPGSLHRFLPEAAALCEARLAGRVCHLAGS